ncbi:MAG: YlxR family protein [Desulfovibrio sp.]|nr:YlxR family protein [Desulfovibrio sp.]
MRMCTICRQRAPKKALTRFTRAPEGMLPLPDLKQKAPGRGMYLCGQPQCREAFSRRWTQRKTKGQEI